MLRIGFIEPHLRRYGGIRRVVELSNALIRHGHDVRIYLPDGERMACDWMRCDATIAAISEGRTAELDMVVFNHEPQWFVAEAFEGARTRAFYALHHGALYGKEGSWEALRTPVDLQLANSAWTADMVEQAIGHRPTVLLGGVNPAHFRPVHEPKRYPLLCVGDDREWKGTDTIEEAARLLGLALEKYAPKDLPQSAMAAEYGAAEVFVVGSTYEGFGQPGLEAMACGTPLVTTDNGGCRDYAIHEQTCLVVPPKDPGAMAAAIDRLRRNPDLAGQLAANGLELVRERFSWDRAAAQLEQLIAEALAGEPDRSVRLEPRQQPSASPELSVVVLAWDQLALTQRCVESIRQHTDVDYELVLVDNGSAEWAERYAGRAGDVPVLNGRNLGFAAGMNAGLAASSGRAVCFLNNDTVMPSGWASSLLKTLDADQRTGIVIPALSDAGNGRTVRQAAQPNVLERLQPFEAPPSGVCYLMRRDQIEALGGWDERYRIASAEDVDLAFAVWTNDLDIVLDASVWVEHVTHGTSDVKLSDREGLWGENRRRLFAKWTDVDEGVPYLGTCSRDRFDRNRATAASVARWMEQYFRQRDLHRALANRPGPLARLAPDLSRGAPRRAARAAWRTLRALVPERVRRVLFEKYREQYYQLFPERHPAAIRGERRVSARAGRGGRGRP